MLTMERFKFDPVAHFYTLDNKPLMGVTTILGQTIAKPQLIQWSANEAVKYIKEAIYEKSLMPLKSELDEIFKRASVAHRVKKEKAGGEGTDVHLLCENIIKGAIQANNGLIEARTEDSPQVQKFIDWAIENKVKFLASEYRNYSEKHWIAGTLDLVCEIDGKKYLGDIKTSSGIYGREYFAQCAAYRMMAEEHGSRDFHGSVIVRMGKKGDFEVVYSYDYEEDLRYFLSALEIYKITNKNK